MSYLIGSFSGRIGNVKTEAASGGRGEQYINMSVAHDQFVRGQNGERAKDTVWMRILIFGNRVQGLSNILTTGMTVSGAGEETVEVWYNEKKGLWIPQITIKAIDIDFGGGNGGQQGQQRQQGGQQQQRPPKQGQQPLAPPQQGQQGQRPPQQGQGQRPPQGQQPQQYGPPPQGQPQGYGPPPQQPQQQRQAPPQQAPQQYGPPPQQAPQQYGPPPAGQAPGYGPTPGFDGDNANDDAPF